MSMMDNGHKMGSSQISSSVSITPAPPMMQSNNDHMNSKLMERSSSREDTQTPAQRQAAAKLALRKQLEKTLLQIPPPKPPPPEMNFIPNPSNTEFVYLLGLETAVDYITKDKKMQSPVAQPFRCSQCKIDFTPLWKWEKQGKTVNATFHNTPSKCADRLSDHCNNIHPFYIIYLFHCLLFNCALFQLVKIQRSFVNSVLQRMWRRHWRPSTPIAWRRPLWRHCNRNKRSNSVWPRRIAHRQSRLIRTRHQLRWPRHLNWPSMRFQQNLKHQHHDQRHHCPANRVHHRPAHGASHGLHTIFYLFIYSIFFSILITESRVIWLTDYQ